jgi:serine/threonine-protein kinase
MQRPVSSKPPLGCIALGDDRHVELGPLIGRGSCSSVHHARILHSPTGIRRPVALKLFGTIATDDRDMVEAALIRSVRRAACVAHPNVAGVYELGMLERSQPFIVSELVVGRSLRVLLDKLRSHGRRLSLDLAIFIGVEVAEGLAGAHFARDPKGHKLEVVHGELSPRDVLLSFNGEVKISDFDLAGARHASSSVRSLKTIAHRMVSLAPEIACGVAADSRADVFSLGLLLREMLLGPRFPRSTEAEIVAAARQGSIDTPTFQPHLPESLSRVLTTALQLDPDRRYPHAGAMALDMRRAAASLGVGDLRATLKHQLQLDFADEMSGVTQP